MIRLARKVLYKVFVCDDEALDPELNDGQRAAAAQAYNEKLAKESLRFLGWLCIGHVVHVIGHSARYSRRLPAMLSTLMLFVTVLTIWFGSRLTRKRAFGFFQVVVCLAFLFHHLALVPAESWVQTLLFFEFTPFFSYFTRGPSDCFSLEDCTKAQNGEHIGGYCYTPSRVDAEALWSILLLDVYHILMVMPAKAGLLLFIPGLSIYVIPVLSLGGRLDDSGWSILVITVAIGLLCSCTRFAKESATRKLLIILESQRTNIISEKLKRCRAEFETDRLRNEFLALSLGAAKAPGESSASSVTSKSWTQPSVPASAPATCLLPYKSSCNGGDCLLETSRVYIEGVSNSLQELRELKEGQRVLCQDTLTGSFEFVTVSAVKAETCPDDIIRLVLEDASIIDMTADHPMPAALAGSSGHALQVLEAQNLLPGTHVLSTWQRRDLQLKEVLRIKPDLRQKNGVSCEHGAHHDEPGLLQAIAVSTQNPMRYKMLVAGPKSLIQSTNVPAVVAVGFSNLDVFNIGCKSTFIEGDIDEQDTTMRRSVSDPAVYDLSRKQTRESDLVQLGVGVKVEGIQHTIGSLPSVGSVDHWKNTCRPCNIHNRYLNGDIANPCRFGASCSFCHEYHDKKERKKMRYVNKHRDQVRKPLEPVPGNCAKLEL